jgi:hypothetical protein
MSNQPTQPTNELQLKFSDETLRGVYANLVQVQHTKEELVLDFMNVFQPMATLNARVIMSPAHVKRLAMLLSSTIANYEKQFGVVEASKEQDGEIGFHTK